MQTPTTDAAGRPCRRCNRPIEGQAYALSSTHTSSEPYCSACIAPVRAMTFSAAAEDAAPAGDDGMHALFQWRGWWPHHPKHCASCASRSDLHVAAAPIADS